MVVLNTDTLISEFNSKLTFGPVRPPQTKTLLSELWGRISTFLPANQRLQFRLVEKRFTGQLYASQAFCGRENRLASTLVNQLMAQNLELGGPLLRAIASNVVELFLELDVLTPERMQSLVKLFPNVETITFTKKKTAYVQPLILIDLASFPKLTSLCWKGVAFPFDGLRLLPKALLELEFIECELDSMSAAHLTNLERLRIIQCPSVKQGAFLNHLPVSLVHLECSDCDLSNRHVQRLAYLEKLQKLDISENSKITGSPFRYLPKSLVALYCSECSLKDKVCKYLANLKMLQILDIEDNEGITGRNFNYLPTSLVTLYWDKN